MTANYYCIIQHTNNCSMRMRVYGFRSICMATTKPLYLFDILHGQIGQGQAKFQR